MFLDIVVGWLFAFVLRKLFSFVHVVLYSASQLKVREANTK